VKLTDFPTLGALSFKEKLELVEELLVSVDPEFEAHLSEEEKNELDSRWAQFERNPSRALTVDQLKTKLAGRSR
jgi:putative addiction module component (TIGR02574 family)